MSIDAAAFCTALLMFVGLGIYSAIDSYRNRNKDLLDDPEKECERKHYKEFARPPWRRR